jgi:hypothetical protein
MNHREIDPSLLAAEPAQDKLDDGFSPPVPAGGETAVEPDPAPAAIVLPPKSPF